MFKQFPSQYSCVSWWNHNWTPSWLHQRWKVMSSRLLYQLGKEMKIWWHQVGTIFRVMQDSENKVLNLCSCSHTYVQLSTVTLKERLLNVRTNSWKSCLQLSPCFTPLRLNSCSRRHEFWMHHAFKVPENSKHDYANRTVVLNFFSTGDPLWWISSDSLFFSDWKLYTQFLSPAMILYKNFIFTFIMRQKLLANIHQFLFQFGVSICTTDHKHTLFSSPDLQLLPDVTWVKCL